MHVGLQYYPAALCEGAIVPRSVSRLSGKKTKQIRSQLEIFTKCVLTNHLEKRKTCSSGTL